MTAQPPAATLDDAELDRWRDLLAREQLDSPWLQQRLNGEASRQQVQQGVLDFLRAFLDGDVDTEEFRNTFHRKTATVWDNFGLKGLNVGMVLNQLVKYVPDEEAVGSLLRESLPAPSDVALARSRMQAMVDFIRRLHKSGQVTPLQLQAARVPPFMSTFWHLQDTERWPIFFVTARNALEAEHLYAPTQDPVTDYFVFREAYLALSNALHLSSWEMERLLVWYHTPGALAPIVAPTSLSDAAAAPAEVKEATEDISPPDAAAEVKAHTKTQLLLAKIGKKLGCGVWIAANDQGRQCEGGKLGDWSMKSLPNLGIDANTQKIIGLIDVLWLKGPHHVVAAFEIEHTTSIYSGLLRLSDLVAVAPMLNIPLYIVSPEDRREQVRRELSRPTFQTLELNKRCGYFSEESLHAEADNIMRWATSPEAIQKLASYVGDVSGEEASQ